MHSGEYVLLHIIKFKFQFLNINMRQFFIKSLCLCLFFLEKFDNQL
jgi:hypothetical protein